MVINRNLGLDIGSDLPDLLDFLSLLVSICAAYAMPIRQQNEIRARGSSPAAFPLCVRS